MRLQRKRRIGLNWWWFTVAVISWMFCGWWIMRVNPNIVKDVLIPGLYLPFGLLIALNIWLTLFTLGRSWWFCIRWSLVVFVLLEMRLSALGHAVNLMLFMGAMLAFEYYLRFKRLES